MEPILVKRVSTATGEVIREAMPKVRRRAVPKAAARMVAEMLIAVTEGEGTGVQAAIDGYQVCREDRDGAEGGPRDGALLLDKFNRVVVGFVPARDPAVAIVVVLDEPMVEHAGGVVAAPVFQAVASMALKYRGLTPQGSSTPTPPKLAPKADPAHAVYAEFRKAQGFEAAVQETEGSARRRRGRFGSRTSPAFRFGSPIQKSIEMGMKPKVEGTGLLARQLPPAPVSSWIKEPRSSSCSSLHMSAAMSFTVQGLSVGDLARELGSVARASRGRGGLRPGRQQDSRRSNRRICSWRVRAARSTARASSGKAVDRGAVAMLTEHGARSRASPRGCRSPGDDGPRRARVCGEAGSWTSHAAPRVAGITGTNGKTTTAWLAERAHRCCRRGRGSPRHARLFVRGERRGRIP